MARPLRAKLDLDALRHNYRLACECAPESRALAVLKANAYGHGALACARALEPLAPAFAVACIEEALELREGGIDKPIVLLEGFFEESELEIIAREGFWTTLHSDWQIEAVERSRLPGPINAWLKFDSGMHRLGFGTEDFVRHWRRLALSPKVCGVHLITHFATADGADMAYANHQLAEIEALRYRLEAEGYEVPCCLANSPATLALARARGQWHRPGLMLYGADPLERANPFSARLLPVMTLESEVIAVRSVEPGEPVGYGGRFIASRPTRIGVVACGYGDGYDRHATDGTPVLVDGRRTAIAGKVSMDMLTVDLTDLPTADIGAKVTLWGRAEDGSQLSVDEVARHCDTISYTLLTGILPRVPRIVSVG